MRCKPGDIAWISRCPGTPENVGLTVEVGADATISPVVGHEWWVTVIGDRSLIVFSTLGGDSTARQAFCPDIWLTRICDKPTAALAMGVRELDRV